MALSQPQLPFPVRKAAKSLLSSSCKAANAPTNPRSPKKKGDSATEDKCVTPPKLQKCGEERTPSTLLQELNISSPRRLQPKGLFPSTASKYQTARKALHSMAPTELPGREKELAELKTFLSECLEQKTSGSIYVSGPPGTGKTATLNKLLSDEDFKNGYKTVYINCTGIKSAVAIFKKIGEELGLAGKLDKAAVEKYLNGKHKTVLLVLDEIDQLDSKRQSVLYTIFEWPSRLRSHTVLVGIANALDLTDRTLPRLQARCELKPRLLHFPPYSRAQIVAILHSRLLEAGADEIFPGQALQMLAAKVAAVSGDVRRALDISRRVVEVAERENCREAVQPLEEVEGGQGDQKAEAKVDLKQVVKVLDNVYGTSQSLDDDPALPLQQKLLLCTLLLVLKQGKGKDVTVGKLLDTFKRVCAQRNALLVVDQGEFLNLCALIETKGIIRLQRKKEPRLQRVSLAWDEEEVGAALKDKTMLSSILRDTSILTK